jgi:hypothetical protein
MEKYVEVVVAYFKALCRYSPFRAEEVRKKKTVVVTNLWIWSRDLFEYEAWLLTTQPLSVELSSAEQIL